jgi:HEAT repeat protein
MDPVAAGALGELIATAISATAGKSWKAIRASPEAQALKTAVDKALVNAFSDANRGQIPADDKWIADVTREWEGAFTAQVSQALISCLAKGDDSQHQFAAVAAQALRASNCNLAELERTFWIEQFLYEFPRFLFDELQNAALVSDSPVRDLVGSMLEQRTEARAISVRPASPRQFREDLVALLYHLDEEARTGRLPPYLPHGADVTTLARTVRARHGVRSGLRLDRGAEKTADQTYELPVERGDSDEPAQPWPQVAAKNSRLIVLADPGLGKSWLIRTETTRLCREALASHSRGDDVAAMIIPVPVRCDQLVGGGDNLAEAITEYLVAQHFLPPRSRTRLQDRIGAGGIVLLLDALDELSTSEQYGLLKELLRSWQAQVGDKARCVLTSRIAGYRGSPLRDVHEIELLAFTAEEVTAAISAWKLKPSVSARVLSRIRDPAVEGMTRVPLLLALLCSLAAELPEGQHLPDTRGQLYERVLRWFLTRAHRADERTGRPELLAEEVDAMLEIMAPVAFHFATRPTGWVDLMPADQLRSAIRDTGPAFTERDRPAAMFIQELSIGAGILVPAGNPSAGRRPGYLFLHRTFAEYLVARHLATLEQQAWTKAVEQHLWFDPDWTEIIPLLSGLLDPGSARGLIDRLLGEAEDPFHHTLLTALRAMGERPDIDLLLSPEALKNVADRVLDLIDCPITRATVSALLAITPKVSQHIIKGLLDRLNDLNWEIRAAAAIALTTRPEPSVTDALITNLDDPVANVRESAATGLANRDAAKVTDALLTHLEDQDWHVRHAVVKALNGRYASAVTEALLTRLHARAYARETIVEVLSDRDTPEVNAALLTQLGYDSGLVRNATIKALRNRHAPEVTEALLAHLSDQDWYVREAVAKTLKGHHTAAVTNALLNHLAEPNRFVWRAIVETLASRDAAAVTEALLVLSSERSSIHESVIWAVASRDTPEVTEMLLSHLDDPDYHVRRAVVQALASRNTPAVTEALLIHLNGPDRLARQGVVWALTSRDTPEVTGTLLKYFNDPDHYVRRAVAQALASRDTPAIADVLLKHLNDPDQRVRLAVVEALAKRYTPAVTEALLNQLDGPDRSVRQAVVGALARRNTPAITKALLKQLDGPDPSVRQAAARALGSRNTPAVTETLLAHLDDPDHEVRIAAVKALALRDVSVVTMALLVHLDDPDEDVRKAVVEALASRDEPVVTETLLAHLNSVDEYMRQVAAAALTRRDVPGDLLTLVDRVRTLDPMTLQTVYKITESLTGSIYLRLPEESQTRIRVELDWLTRCVVQAGIW